MTKILLVEDHEELWDSLSRRLRRRNFDVMLAHDGQQALDQLAVESPDLILLDMNLPVMDGWTVAQTLRAQGNRVPIIALTARAMAADRQRSIESGCDEFHAKPVVFDELLRQIDELLLKAEEQS